MEKLKAEICQKLKLVEDQNLLGERKKYFKRSELAKKEEAYFERSGYKIQPKEKDQKPLPSPNPVLEVEPAEGKLPVTLSRPQVLRQFRERGEPVRLFGETDYDAFLRLRKIEILTPEVNKGLRNDLKAALDKIDQQDLDEMASGQEPGENDTRNDLKVHEENITFEELEALGKSLGKGDDQEDMDIITKFLLQREYVKANDAYLQMAIGSAPWPIGVTMVGIHARTGREKIFSKHVAHVLNDETQRKYIQGLKRLMTICQKHFSTDPSKCVEYNAL
ncbi:pre-mRNA-splicing factor 18-like isoform X4 [Monodelphis domestica]|uniref:pre-mRNA-splicing factor 18-like isoform X4 n=1 Tax=Monodelphis domestica TaxID=13616 RepID=UPI0024E1D938|nr:pre-mRNA-splicing factor 18-like isoform X4 [Monodelphis domestica]